MILLTLLISFQENVLRAIRREWKIDWYSALHYAAVMKYAKIEIKDKTLFVQTEAERTERKDEKKSTGTRPLFSVRSVSAPRQREFVQLSKLTAIFNGTNCRDSSPSCGTQEDFPTYSPACLRYFSELCIALRCQLR